MSYSGNISAKYLAEHNARMLAWRAGEVHLLVKEQESAVKAVRLERLVGSVGQTGAGQTGAGLLGWALCGLGGVWTVDSMRCT